ncbi:hypothetical protein [Streptomyces sp. NPDC087300]|uniref:hypothetical protein n=1 Tax=Streptomyces sp. NPDC087300 TaxID=3365780 RepID=UPI0037F4897F
MIRLVEVPPASSPAAAKVVVYACIAPAENVDLDDALRPTRAYVKEQGWEEVAVFVDRAYVAVPCAEREQWMKALAQAEAGAAVGVVVPSIGMVAMSDEDKRLFAEWQQKTGAFVSSPGSRLGAVTGRAYGFQYPAVPSTTVADDRRSGAEQESRPARDRG